MKNIDSTQVKTIIDKQSSDHVPSQVREYWTFQKYDSLATKPFSYIELHKINHTAKFLENLNWILNDWIYQVKNYKIPVKSLPK